MISSSGILVDSGSRYVLRSSHSVRTVALLTLACPIHMESHGFYTTPGAVLKKNMTVIRMKDASKMTPFRKPTIFSDISVTNMHM